MAKGKVWGNRRDAGVTGRMGCLLHHRRIELAQFACSGQHLVGARPHANVFGEVDPAHHARRVHQELRRAGDVVPFGPATRVQQVVAADDLGAGVGEYREGVTGLAGQIARNLRRVHADCHRADAGSAEFGETFLDSSQLEVAEGSPIAAIENEQHGLGGAGPSGSGE